jgi:hypothetical protein
MNQHERDRLSMTERGICEGEKQIARLSRTIRELERKGNEFAAARARKLLEDFQYDLNLNHIQFESGGLGPCLDARHAHMAAFPEGGFVKTGVTR